VPPDAAANSVLELTALESGTIVRVPVTVTVPVPPAAAPKALTRQFRDTIATDQAAYRAGDTITIGVGAAHAGGFVSVWVQSKPANLGGWVLVNARGEVSATLPADIRAGKHEISVQDATGAVLGWTEITVGKVKGPKGR
jgi:5'-nucleotidase